ncbi:MAG: NUDIX domain-containing protein, partial [Ilumatobacteraceae bacterium]
MARIDYFDDPDAPTPNSIVPAAVGCVVDDQGRLLLEHRVDNDLWALPGGTHDFGESIEQTVVREIREETALNVEVTGLVG